MSFRWLRYLPWLFLHPRHHTRWVMWRRRRHIDGHPLIRAASRGDVHDVVRLIDAGLDVESATPSGTTALRVAAEKGHLKLVLSLLGRSAYPSDGAMADAASTGQMEVLELLLTARAEYPSPGIHPSVLVVAVALSGKTEVVDALLRRGFLDVNQIHVPGLSLLDGACSRGNSKMAMFLLECGADVNQGAPLWSAARDGDLDLVRALLRHGADPNQAYSWSGSTAVMVAAYGGKADAVRELLDSGADPFRRDRSGKDALAHARRRKANEAVIALLGEAGRQAA